MPRRSSTATLGVALSFAGMGALCAGFKLTALSLFGAGVELLEKDWRARHPEFVGNAAERWQASLSFYRDTHKNGTNRTLHLIGIPLIVGGAVGLFASKPLSPVRGALWATSLAAFATGWGLNLVGHAVFEKRAPAFSDDGLSFIAGPVWDLQELLSRAR
ncbi:MAG TPA: DUF962 domain-containing protein [Polyangiaceae bacterium]|nr:DUF962 domain-containing protein [Polyangiaceae bacterium]